MREIGVFVCNYNKAEFIVKCVEKIMTQTCMNTDIFVVDNASTDDSVRRLRETYGDQITILENRENLGGSGGFGRGIRTALKMGYPYFMLVDNDAFLDTKAIEHLYSYMEAHRDVGICGAKTLYLQEPSKIQDMGGRIDYQRYQWGGVMGGLAEFEGNVVLECDYVASCCVMARTRAVREFGGFPEDNFIYWDDIEWCTKCWRAGYKVVVDGNAKAFHDMSGANPRNMFLRYYANRNRWNFFVKYLPKEKLEDFYQVVTEEFFRRVYGAMHKEMYGTALTEWNALDDFMNGIRGKAGDGKICAYTTGREWLGEKAAKARRILVYMPEHTIRDYGGLNRLLKYLAGQNKETGIAVAFSMEGHEMETYDLVLQLCEHVTDIRENILPRVYVDGWGNAVLDEQDYRYFSCYRNALENFRRMYRPLFEMRKQEAGKGD